MITKEWKTQHQSPKELTAQHQKVSIYNPQHRPSILRVDSRNLSHSPPPKMIIPINTLDVLGHSPSLREKSDQ